MTKIKFSTSQFLAALALAAAIGLMVQAININPAAALEAAETAEEDVSKPTVSDEAGLIAAIANESVTEITVAGDFTVTQPLTVNRDGALVIDLGGHTITSADAGHLLTVEKGQVTIKNGTLERTNGANAVIVVRGANEDQGANYATVTVASDVTLKSSGYCAMIGANLSGAKNHAYGAKLVFNGNCEGLAGLYVNGTIQDTAGNIPEITVGNSVDIKASNTGIYAAGYAKWDIGRAVITAGNAVTRDIDGTGVGMKAGILNFNGTTITAYGNGTPSGNNNGFSGAGAVFQIENNGNYAGGVKITINGGNYTSTYQPVFLQHEDSTDNLNAIAINGGTFKAPAGVAIFQLTEDDQSDQKVKITAGVFSAEIPPTYLEGDWQQKKDENGNWVIGSATTTPSTPEKPSDDKDKDNAAGTDIETPNTGALNRSAAVNAIASVSLAVSIFVAAGIFYNRFKVYHRAKRYVPHPSAERIRRK